MKQITHFLGKQTIVRNVTAKLLETKLIDNKDQPN